MYDQALRAYFHANGSGVALPYLDTSSSVIQSALSLYQKDTQVLLDLYAAVSEKVGFLLLVSCLLFFFSFAAFVITSHYIRVAGQPPVPRSTSGARRQDPRNPRCGRQGGQGHRPQLLCEEG